MASANVILLERPMPHPTRRAFLESAAALACAGMARGQQEPVFSTDVKVVNVLATVRNRTGAIVRALNQDDFSLSEDGRPQTIRYFARETDLPLTLGLMVDTSGSQRKVLDAERGASYHFLDQVVRPNKDRVFIMQFDSAVLVRQGLTNSLKKLDDALDYVDSETMRQLRMQNGGGTLLYDAVIKASDEIMKNEKGRKAVILLTDGVDIGSYGSVPDSIEAAQRADTLIYSILYSDSGAYGLLGGGRDGRKVLERMSGETGGGFFEVSKKLTVDQVFEILQEELRTQYNLGYVSDKPVTVAEFRKIQLTVKPKGLTVQARQKYWAQR
jgi:VWFA-related protein